MSIFPPMAGSTQQAIQDLKEYGIALLPELLTGDKLREARDAVYAGPTDDADNGRTPDRYLIDYGTGNVRVWNLLNRGSVFVELVQHPLVLELLEEVLGPQALLSGISANIAEPGSEGGALHADQGGYPPPWPAEPQGLNFTWLLDDFTADNGATEMVPGSHRREDPSKPPLERPLPATAPAETVVALESRVWHRTGSNLSEAPRAAAFAWYVRPIYRTQENWFLALNDDVLEGASDELLTLLGYRTEVLGTVYGRSPR